MVSRKLAAILYADVAEYSRLTRRDEEGTHRTLSAYLDEITARIEDHGGTVAHYAGDAVLAEFASVIAAVSSAIAIQNELAGRNSDLADDLKLRFRIGINLGEVIVDRGEIYGDGVNVAARLETLAQPGGICVSGKVYDEVQTRLDVGFAYLGPQTVKNIAEPVEAYRVVPEGAEGAAPGDQPREAHGPRLRRHVVRQWWPVAAGIVIGITAAWALWPSPPPPPLPTATPSIAVLPFRVIGADRDQTSFTEGLSEDLITALAENTGMRVVSGALPADGAKTTRDVGRELNALYVLDGSVRTEGNKVRVSAQLVASDTGFHLWGGRYDRLLGDVLALQDDVSARIVKTLAAKLIEAEGERRQRTVGEPIVAGGFLIAGLEYLGRVAEQAVVIPGELFRRVFGEERG